MKEAFQKEEQDRKKEQRQTSVFDSTDYFQRIEDDAQEKYLAKWSREHDRKKTGRE